MTDAQRTSSPPDTGRPTFGDLLRQYRRTTGLSQEELAEQAGLSTQAVSALERGVRQAPYRETVQMLARALQLSPEDRKAFEAAARASQGRGTRVEDDRDRSQGRLPAGSMHVFLLSDVEDSVGLWERQPAAMRAALARHDVLAAAGVEGHGGRLLKSRGEGDSLFAVFARVSDAVAAALAFQRALLAEPWPAGLAEQGGPRVRIAIHAGEVEERDGDYYGSVVNRCARLRGLAHGGQILLSAVAAALARETLPDGASLHPLGTYRLAGMEWPEHVYQLSHPALPQAFPPLRAPRAASATVPIPPTSLIGREREVGQVVSLLAQPGVRLVTLTGPGGVGKTRVAMEVAALVAPEVDDGVLWVPLAALQSPDLVLQTIALAAGARETGSRSTVDGIVAILATRSPILVLDNFEHVLPAAPLVAEIMAACPGLRVLATSRSPLNLRGERVVPLDPLAIPDPDHLPSLEELARVPAVALLLERARSFRPDLHLDVSNARAMATICRRLDGLPLALELVAARMAALSPRPLAERLALRLPLLTGGASDLPERQRTLRATLIWSYELLSSGEQAVFGRLAVFVGGCSLEAAEAVCGADQPLAGDVLDWLAALVDKSLLRREILADGEPRFEMLETIREYASERLAASGYAQEALARHAAYYLKLGEAAQPLLEGPDQGDWLVRLDRELDNFRVVLQRALAGDQPVVGLRLAVALGDYWAIRGYFGEGRRWIEELLDLAAADAAASPALRGKALNMAGLLAAWQGDMLRSLALHEASLALCREAEDVDGISTCLSNIGTAAFRLGDYARAEALLEEALAMRRARGNKRDIAIALGNLAMVAAGRDDHARSAALSEESLAIFRGLGDQHSIAVVLNNLGSAYLDLGDLERARRLYEESIALARRLGAADDLLFPLQNLAAIALKQGRHLDALALSRESLSLAQETGNRLAMAHILEGLAEGHHGLGDPVRAARFAGAAAALRTDLAAPLPPAEQMAFDGLVATMREGLGDDLFAGAWSEGQAAPVEVIIAQALAAGQDAEAAASVPGRDPR